MNQILRSKGQSLYNSSHSLAPSLPLLPQPLPNSSRVPAGPLGQDGWLPEDQSDASSRQPDLGKGSPYLSFW